MKHQLALLDPPSKVWKLDRATIEAGREGVAQARAALREAAERARQADGEAA